MNAVKIIRLMSGEEIIANTTETTDTILLKDASVLIPSPEGKLLLAKWLPYANIENGITIEKKHIVFVVDPQKELTEHFTTVMVNNLVIPGNKKSIDPTKSRLKLTV